MPASEQELHDAAMLYFYAYGHELPMWDYRKQDIEYIIEQLTQKLLMDVEPFSNHLVH